MERSISVRVNGRVYQANVEPRLLLSDFLREELRLTGTHVGCEHGVCGACTVLLNGEPVRSCLLFAIQTDAHEVTTVEGLAGDGPLLPIQEAFKQENGLQCGFCTPGILLSAHHLLGANEPPDEATIREVLSGHICRCTGYQNIVSAVLRAAGERDVEINAGGQSK